MAFARISLRVQVYYNYLKSKAFIVDLHIIMRDAVLRLAGEYLANNPYFSA
jgi:hypothetical protein